MKWHAHLLAPCGGPFMGYHAVSVVAETEIVPFLLCEKLCRMRLYVHLYSFISMRLYVHLYSFIRMNA
jgi:hypothetical protein